ncbi:hypothetical protein [Krasilnikovia sp. MM14-A1004]|uniref:hypothetical protein n=1 Tax=Krasilnikovia sp. MM14-A1004 TaxID=3373541 RepID=UPI00399CB5A8
MAGLLAGLATALAATVGVGAPATAAPAAHIADAKIAADEKITINFRNEGWYYAYADVWAYDANGNEIDHDWSGTYGHGAGHKLQIRANAAHVKMLVRYDPTAETIKEQWIDDWMNYGQKYCSKSSELPTIYVGGTYHHADTYDIHCKKQ